MFDLLAIQSGPCSLEKAARRGIDAGQENWGQIRMALTLAERPLLALAMQ